MISKQYFLLFFITVQIVICSQIQKIKDEIQSCQPQIVDQLINQKIPFKQNNQSILVSQINSISLQLILNNCYSEETLLFEEIQNLDFTDLKLFNVNSTKIFITIQSINTVLIKNLELSNHLNYNISLLIINLTQNVIIDQFINNNTFLNEINCENNINIGSLKIESTQDINLKAGNQTCIEKIISYNSTLKIKSNDVNINYINLKQSQISIEAAQKLSIITCDEYNVSLFHSLLIYINNLHREFIDQKQKIQLFFYCHGEEQYQFKQYLSLYINNCNSVTMNDLQIKSLDFVFNFSYLKTLQLKNLIFNQDSMGSLSITGCESVVIESVQIIGQIKQGCQRIALSLYSNTFVSILNFNINSVLMCDSLFDLFELNNVVFEEIKISSVRYKANCLINIQDCINVSFKKMKIINQNKEIIKDYPDYVKAIDNNFIKKYLYKSTTVHSLIYFQSTKSYYYSIKQNVDNQLITFSDIKADFGGYNSRFFDFTQDDQYTGNITTKINIDNSNFSNMYSDLNGGCLRIMFGGQNWKWNQILNISSSNFFNCSGYQGGAIFTNAFVFLEDVVFEQSKSLLGGAAVIFDDQRENNQNYKKSFKNITFSNNYSKYSKHFHNDIFIFWSKFEIDEVIEIAESNQNGTKIDKPIKLTNNYYQLFPGITYIFTVTMKSRVFSLENDDEDQYIEQKLDEPIFQNLYSYFDFNPLSPYSPSKIQNIYFLDYELDQYNSKPHLIAHFLSNTCSFDISFIYNNQIHFTCAIKNCISGQQFIQISSLDQRYQCKYCPYMSASYAINSTNCFPCDSLYFEYCYSNVTSLNKGFHRQISTLNQSQIYFCQYNVNSCIGGEGFGNQLCAEGHIGNECKCCDTTGQYWNQTYGSNGYYTCIKCRDIQNNRITLLLLLISFIVITFFIINSNTNSIEKLLQYTYLSRMGIIYLGTSLSNQGLTSVYIKIFSFTATMMHYAIQQMNLNYKNLLLNFSIQFQNPLIDAFISLDCAITDMFTIQNNFSTIKLLTFVFFPLLVCQIIILVFIIKILFQKLIKFQIFLNSILLSCIYITFIVFYNPTLSIVIDALSCRTFKSGDRQYLLDLSVSCDKIQSNYFISLPSLILYCIGIPLFIVIILFLNRKQLSKIRIMFKYGFLYKEYKEKYFYWEMIRFLVRVIQIVISKVFIYNFEFMNCLNIMILVIYSILIQKFKPFLRTFINQLELISVTINIQNYLSLIILQSSQKNILSDNSILPEEYILKISTYISFSFLLVLIIMIIFSILNIFSFKIQNSEKCQRIFNCMHFKKKQFKIYRGLQNLKLFKEHALRLVQEKKLGKDELQTLIKRSKENEDLISTKMQEENQNQNFFQQQDELQIQSFQ